MMPPAIPALVAFQRIIRVTPRERSVLRCLSSGMANKEIATSLSLAEGTVKTYLCRLCVRIFGHGKGDRFKLLVWWQQQQRDTAYVSLTMAWALQMPRARWPKIEERKT